MTRIATRLAELLGVPANQAEIQWQPIGSGNKIGHAKISVAGFKFVVQWKASGTAEAVAMAIRTVREFASKSREKIIPVVAAPYLGAVGQKLCAEADVCWLDLSGNAHLVASGLRVIIEGKPNQFKRPGRPRSLFAPKSSRIARFLLVEPERSVSQRELAKATGMDEGFTSRIVRKLEEQQLICRNSTGNVQLANFDGLLEAWREAYDFSRHHIVRGHIAARSSDELLAKLAEDLRRDEADFAATGLAGAWLWNKFAGFRLVTLYVSELPSSGALERLGFREEARGENVWLVVPNDAGVFHGATEREGIRCVHPVQVYLDLKGHPERSAEAAMELRRLLSAGNRHAK